MTDSLKRRRRKFWQCGACGMRWYRPDLWLALIICGCGKGKGQWFVQRRTKR
jgi:hypothetical protein